MRQKSILKAALLATALAFGVVSLTPAAPAYADGVEDSRGGAKKKPTPKRKPKPAPVQQAPQMAPMPAPIMPTGPRELTLPSSFFEGSGGVGVHLTGGGGYGGGVVIIGHGHSGSPSGIAGRSAFFSGGGKGCK